MVNGKTLKNILVVLIQSIMISTVYMLMASILHVAVLVYGHLWLNSLRTKLSMMVIITVPGSLQSSYIQSLLVMITFVNLGPIITGNISFIQMILSGMGMGVVLLNKLVVKLLVSHGSTRSLTLPLLTTSR